MQPRKPALRGFQVRFPRRVGHVRHRCRARCPRCRSRHLTGREQGDPGFLFRTQRVVRKRRCREHEGVVTGRPAVTPFQRPHPDPRLTPEQGVPIVWPEGPWELCYTINDSWGFQHADHNHKPLRQLIRVFAETVGAGGNLLLDVGPQEDGTIIPEHAERLEGLGAWIRRHSDAVFGTVAGLPYGHHYGPSTVAVDRRTIYLTCLGTPGDGGGAWPAQRRPPGHRRGDRGRAGPPHARWLPGAQRTRCALHRRPDPARPVRHRPRRRTRRRTRPLPRRRPRLAARPWLVPQSPRPSRRVLRRCPGDVLHLPHHRGLCRCIPLVPMVASRPGLR
ncbi:alpha-L-fucosidase [Dactylosporangium sucinum]|uniref:alpha-L-fucosidase n=1 Tax=Dactylosporangium sucinum TaxID=1424081 RepID=UPI0035714DD0